MAKEKADAALHAAEKRLKVLLVDSLASNLLPPFVFWFLSFSLFGSHLFFRSSLEVWHAFTERTQWNSNHHMLCAPFYVPMIFFLADAEFLGILLFFAHGITAMVCV